MLKPQLSKYPVDLDSLAHFVLFGFLGCKPTKDAELLLQHAHHLKLLIHTDQIPTVTRSGSADSPIVKEARRILTDGSLNKVYRCGGLQDVCRVRRSLRTCMDCDHLFGDRTST